MSTCTMEVKMEVKGDVAEAGGWSDTRALRLSYQQSDPQPEDRFVAPAGPWAGLWASQGLSSRPSDTTCDPYKS